MSATNEWATDKINAWNATGRFIALLGSFPTHGKPTQGEAQRSDYLARAAQRLGLMIHEDSRSDGRRYVFAERHFLIHPSHTADVSGLVFGDLSEADSEGYVSPLAQIDLGCRNDSMITPGDWEHPPRTDEEYIRRGHYAANLLGFWRYVMKRREMPPCCVEMAAMAQRIAAETKEEAA